MLLVLIVPAPENAEGVETVFPTPTNCYLTTYGARTNGANSSPYNFYNASPQGNFYNASPQGNAKPSWPCGKAARVHLSRDGFAYSSARDRMNKLS